MGKEPSSRVPLYARYPVLGCGVREVTDDHLELQVLIVLIQAYLVVLCATLSARHRAHSMLNIRLGAVPDTEVKTPGFHREARTAAQTGIGSLILHTEDCEVIRRQLSGGGADRFKRSRPAHSAPRSQGARSNSLARSCKSGRIAGREWQAIIAVIAVSR